MTTVTFDVDLPKLLRMWRAYSGLSQRKLATRAEAVLHQFNPGQSLSYDIIRRYEAGDFRPEPDTAALWAIAKALGRSTSEFPPEIVDRIAVMMTWLTPSLQATA